MILDTNALSAWADGQPSVHGHFQSATRVVVPVVALGEYLFGILQSRYRQRYEQWLNQNLPFVELAVVDRPTAREYGQLRLELKQQATPIPANDACNAGVSLSAIGGEGRGQVVRVLSVHPRIVAQQEPRIRGVGAGILYGLCELAGQWGISVIWGETTETSVTFYRKTLRTESLLDGFTISGSLLEHCRREFHRSQTAGT